MSLPEHHPEPISAPTTKVAQQETTATGHEPVSLQAPSLWRRMACWLYESMLLFGVVWISAYFFGAMTQQRHGLHNRWGLMLFLFLMLGVYFAWFWHKGQTLSMKTWHLRLVDAQGQPVSQARAFARYVLSWLWLLPPLAFVSASSIKYSGGTITGVVLLWVLIYALLSHLMPQRQFVHDVLAKTRLVSHKPMSKYIPA